MLFGEMDATGWALIIAASTVGVGGIVTSTVTLVIGFLERKRTGAREEAKLIREAEMAKKVENVAVRAEEVKVTLETSKIATDKKLDVIHDLVNSQLGRALSATATLARWKATQTSAAGDVMAADIAERALAEHMEKQAVADAAVVAKEKS